MIHRAGRIPQNIKCSINQQISCFLLSHLERSARQQCFLIRITDRAYVLHIPSSSHALADFLTKFREKTISRN